MLEGQLRTEQRAREALAAQLAEASQRAADAAADARAAARHNSAVVADVREVQQVRDDSSEMSMNGRICACIPPEKFG
jgi:protein subunit release factor B